MQRRNFTFSKRHDDMLIALSKKINISMTEALQRALELLEEKEAQRDREVGQK